MKRLIAIALVPILLAGAFTVRAAIAADPVASQQGASAAQSGGAGAPAAPPASDSPRGASPAGDPHKPGAPALQEAASAAQADLDKSLAELVALRESIKAEKVPLSAEVTALEDRLSDLRRKYDETSRAKDMHSLEEGNLGAALKLRQDEIQYVSNLLDEYARGFDATVFVGELPRYAPLLEAAKSAPQDKDLTIEERFKRQTELLRASLDRIAGLLGGLRLPGEAVGPEGTLASGQFALVGPVALFAATAGAPAGLAISQTGSTRAVVRTLDAALTMGLSRIVTTGEGTLPLDPSRGGALQQLIHRGSLIGYFKKGGPIMYPLLLVSILALTVVLERLFFLARVRRHRDPETVREILSRVGIGDLDGAIEEGRGSRDYIVSALTYALQHREKSLSNALMRASSQELVEFSRGVSILDTVVTMAPLLGLLGTVTGMMGSFGMLGGAELSAPAQITGGIAEALIATAFGLGIAITSLIPLNYLHSKSDEARHEMEDACTHLEILMKPILDAEGSAVQERLIESLSRRAATA